MGVCLLDTSSPTPTISRVIARIDDLRSQRTPSASRSSGRGAEGAERIARRDC